MGNNNKIFEALAMFGAVYSYVVIHLSVAAIAFLPWIRSVLFDCKLNYLQFLFTFPLSFFILLSITLMLT